MIITTGSLVLRSRTREEVLSDLERMSVEDRRHVSPEWLASVQAATTSDPWILGFIMSLTTDGKVMGQCGFTGPPGPDGVVEIAYGVDPEYQGRGYATEAARGLVSFALADSRVRSVRAHTLPQENASTRVLIKCGFCRAGEHIDHEAGVVWRWELRRPAD